MNDVPGTRGYNQAASAFAKVSFELDFNHINSEFLEFLPKPPARVLDAGAGPGQNSAALARLDYQVVAVEPLQAFLDIAQSTFTDLDITWIRDSLPRLEKLDSNEDAFDFILLDGVWHHLDSGEREECIRRLSGLMATGGVCAISLRNGPAGIGKHLFPTSNEELISLAQDYGLCTVLSLKNQPSKMKNKPDVIWSKVALQKNSER